MGRGLATILLVAVVVTSAGCTGFSGSGEGSSGLTKADVLHGMETLERYEFELTRTTSIGGTNVTVMGTGAVDEPADRYRVALETEGAARATAQELYVVENTLYVSGEAIRGSEWLRKPASGGAPTGVPVTIANIAEQRSLVEAGDVERRGTKTVDGVETTVVSVALDTELAADLDGTIGGPGGSIERVDYRLFVEASTGFVRGVSLTIEAQGKDGPVTTRTEVRLSDHNGDVDVTLPEAARNATDASGLGGEE